MGVLSINNAGPTSTALIQQQYGGYYGGGGMGGVLAWSSDQIHQQQHYGGYGGGPQRTGGVFSEDLSSNNSQELAPAGPGRRSKTDISTSSTIFVGNRTWSPSRRSGGRATELAGLLARHPTSHETLKVTVESVLKVTEWPPESKEAAEDLLRIVQGISGLEHGDSDSQKATRLVGDIGSFITSISKDAVRINGHFCDVFEGMHSTAE
ncbi:hypothetical protein FRC05_001606 [Tulasnella sp. 425]|nr:hypothetical protein FRC05_001606 [Tulasnella sp. 425]